MKLYIAMIASVIAISGCKKDEDSGAAEECVAATTCADFLTDYGSCDGIDADMVAAYEAALEGFSDEQCGAAADSWAAAGCCAQY